MAGVGETIRFYEFNIFVISANAPFGDPMIMGAASLGTWAPGGRALRALLGPGSRTSASPWFTRLECVAAYTELLHFALRKMNA